MNSWMFYWGEKLLLCLMFLALRNFSLRTLYGSPSNWLVSLLSRISSIYEKLSDTQTTDAESYFKAYFLPWGFFCFGLGGCFAVGFFADTFTSCIDPSVQICHDTQVVSDFVVLYNMNWHSNNVKLSCLSQSGIEAPFPTRFTQWGEAVWLNIRAGRPESARHRSKAWTARMKQTLDHILEAMSSVLIPIIFRSQQAARFTSAKCSCVKVWCLA